MFHQIDYIGWLVGDGHIWYPLGRPWELRSPIEMWVLFHSVGVVSSSRRRQPQIWEYYRYFQHGARLHPNYPLVVHPTCCRPEKGEHEMKQDHGDNRSIGINSNQYIANSLIHIDVCFDPLQFEYPWQSVLPSTHIMNVWWHSGPLQRSLCCSFITLAGDFTMPGLGHFSDCHFSCGKFNHEISSTIPNFHRHGWYEHL